MIDKAYLRGTQTKNTKCYLSVRDIQKNIYHENCIQNKFKREKYVYYKYGSLKSYQRRISYLLTEVLDKILLIQFHKGKSIQIQYWCIDGIYRKYMVRLTNREKTSFSLWFLSGFP